jgi:DNA-binding IscR family transcriptional regulator
VACWFLGAKKERGGYYLIKDPKEINMAHVYRILEGPIAYFYCQSQFHEKCADKDEQLCRS